MERHLTHYNEAGELFGTRNAWEYYFEQPGNLTVSEALTMDALESGGSVTGTFVVNPKPVLPPELQARARLLIKKYICVKSNVLSRVDAILPPGVHGSLLGVHVRGTDMRLGSAWQHGVSATPLTYLAQAKALDEEHCFQQIFLACDEVETLTMFQAQFGSRLTTATAHRSSVGCDLTEDYQWLFRPNRDQHCYRLGLEVLVDALLLSRCGHLLCGTSNVSRSATFFSDDRQRVHLIPPLWVTPPFMGPSTGHARLANAPSLPYPASSEVLQTHIGELRRLLEMTENSRASAYDEQNEKLAAALTELQNTRLQLGAAQKEAESACKEVVTLKKELRRATSALEQMQDRIRQLMNGWTLLGWRLMPWKKPHWRHHPTKPKTQD